MKKKKCYKREILYLILIIILLINLLLPNVVAEHREYDVEIYEDKIIIPGSSLKTIDIEFTEGDELELIYTLKVKQDLPIDVWFVDDDNYYIFVAGGEYYYYIDGSAQQVSFAREVVAVSEYDIYQLILANYNNQTIEVDIIYETRIYSTETDDSSSDESFLSSSLYPFLIIVVILVAVLVFLFIKNREIKQEFASATSIKVNSKRSKRRNNSKNNSKKEKTKNRSRVQIYNRSKKHRQTKKSRHKNSNKRSKTNELKDGQDNKNTNKNDIKDSKRKNVSDPGSFCGYCGKQVETPFCKYCGNEV